MGMAYHQEKSMFSYFMYSEVVEDKFNCIVDLNSWDMSSITNVNDMFLESGNIDIYLSDWGLNDGCDISNIMLNSKSRVSCLEKWTGKLIKKNSLTGSRYISKKGYLYSERFARNFGIPFPPLSPIV